MLTKKITNNQFYKTVEPLDHYVHVYYQNQLNFLLLILQSTTTNATMNKQNLNAFNYNQYSNPVVSFESNTITKTNTYFIIKII